MKFIYIFDTFTFENFKQSVSMDQYITDTEPVYDLINYIEKNIDCQNKWQLQLLQMAVSMIGQKGPFKFDITTLTSTDMIDDQTEMYIGQKDVPLTTEHVLCLLKDIKYYLGRKEKNFIEIVKIKDNKYKLHFE